MAPLPQIKGKKNMKRHRRLDTKEEKIPDDDDFIPTKKKPIIKPEDAKAMFEHSYVQSQGIKCALSS